LRFCPSAVCDRSPANHSHDPEKCSDRVCRPGDDPRFSTSQNRDWAKKSLDQFVEVINIEEGLLPLPPGTETMPGAKPPGSKDDSI